MKLMYILQSTVKHPNIVKKLPQWKSEFN